MLLGASLSHLIKIEGCIDVAFGSRLGFGCQKLATISSINTTAFPVTVQNFLKVQGCASKGTS